jgi:hypothetical protein
MLLADVKELGLGIERGEILVSKESGEVSDRCGAVFNSFRQRLNEANDVIRVEVVAMMCRKAHQ